MKLNKRGAAALKPVLVTILVALLILLGILVIGKELLKISALSIG